MSIKAILFDLDGTLVDSNDAHVLAWEAAFQDHGSVIGRPAIHAQIGKGADMLVPSLIPGAATSMIEALDKAQAEIFKTQYLAAIRPFQHAHDLLKRAAQDGCKVVFASSASQSDLDHYIDLLDAKALVAATTCADDVGSSKPAPDIFDTARSKVAPLGPDEVMVLGDSPYDVEAAGRAGIAAVAVRSGGFPDPVLFSAGAIALYDDVSALLKAWAESPFSR